MSDCYHKHCNRVCAVSESILFVDFVLFCLAIYIKLIFLRLVLRILYCTVQVMTAEANTAICAAFDEKWIVFFLPVGY